MAGFKSFEEIGARQKVRVTVRFFKRVETEYETLKQGKASILDLNIPLEFSRDF